MRQPSRLAAILVVLAAVAFGSTAAEPATAATSSASAVQVTLTVADSGELAAGDPLRAFVTVANPTASDTAAGTATLSVDPTPFSSRAALADWFSGKSKTSVASRTVVRTTSPGVASQQSGVVSMLAASSTLGFATAGVYGVSVSVTDGSAVLGTARTAIAWNLTHAAAVPVAIALPITVPAADSEFLTAAQLAQYTAPDGVLTQELADVQNSQIALGIDPRIIASIRILGKNAPATATAWLLALKNLPNDTFPLAWADADLTAPLHAGAPAVLKPKSLAYAINPALFPPATGPTASPTPSSGSGTSTVPTSASLVAWRYTLPALEWPTDNSVEPSDLDKLNKAGITGVILTSSNVDESNPTGLGGASGKSDSTTIAVSDDVLSGYLRDAVEATTREGSAASLTELATTLGLIGLKSGKTPRTVLLTLGRNWVDDDANFARGVDDLYTHSWVSSALLSSVFADPPNSLTLDKDTEPAARVSFVADMMAAEARVGDFSVIALDPSAITSSYRLQLLSMLSNEWLDTPAAWKLGAKAYVTQAGKVVASVQVARSDELIGLSAQVALPISITNGLDQDVTVTLTVRPTTPRVSVNPRDQTQTITISADSQKRVQVPIEALSNGSAKLVVSLSSPNGGAIGKPVVLRVNVQAGWETLGTLIFVAFIAALFAFGIIRNIRKRRRTGEGGTEDE